MRNAFMTLPHDANTSSAQGGVKVSQNCPNVASLRPAKQISLNESFVSKDHDSVIIGKIAQKLDNGSMLSRRSNNFKTLSPVNVDG